MGQEYLFDSLQWHGIFCSKHPNQPLGSPSSPQFHNHWEEKWLGGESHLSPPSCVEVKSNWRYASTILALVAYRGTNLPFTFNFFCGLFYTAANILDWTDILHRHYQIYTV
jgi:hypothetical protein